MTKARCPENSGVIRPWTSKATVFALQAPTDESVQDGAGLKCKAIRDGETASIAVQAALTGHLVLSSLHTNDAPTAVPRLRGLVREDPVPSFIGTYPGYIGASNFKIATGALFTSDDITDHRKVVVLGSTVAQDLFDTVDPLGKQLTVSGKLFTVVGVLAERILQGVLEG